MPVEVAAMPPEAYARGAVFDKYLRPTTQVYCSNTSYANTLMLTSGSAALRRVLMMRANIFRRMDTDICRPRVSVEN